MNKSALIIFTKNPEKGKAKTRLAKTIGNDNALLIYKELLSHTAQISKEVDVERYAFYSSHIGNNEYFEDDFFKKRIQKGDDLGEKMLNAFQELAENNFDKIVIIGSDCYDLKTNNLKDAFEALNYYDTVIGPAKDGGFYLLGLKEVIPSLFLNRVWSTDNVLKETVDILKNCNKTFTLLQTLSDVDYEEDLGDLKNLIVKD